MQNNILGFWQMCGIYLLYMKKKEKHKALGSWLLVLMRCSTVLITFKQIVGSKGINYSTIFMLLNYT